ncbi:hypothetical protein THAOC_17159, partial [Thalassiosira oceanica]
CHSTSCDEADVPTSARTAVPARASSLDEDGRGGRMGLGPDDLRLVLIQ